MTFNLLQHSPEDENCRRQKCWLEDLYRWTLELRIDDGKVQAAFKYIEILLLFLLQFKLCLKRFEEFLALRTQPQSRTKTTREFFVLSMKTFTMYTRQNYSNQWLLNVTSIINLVLNTAVSATRVTHSVVSAVVDVPPAPSGFTAATVEVVFVAPVMVKTVIADQLESVAAAVAFLYTRACEIWIHQLVLVIVFVEVLQ